MPVLHSELQKLVDRYAPETFVLADFTNKGGVKPYRVPLFCKSRPLWDNMYIPLPVSRRKLWDPLREVRKHDVPFSHKKDILVWRGQLSGMLGKPFGGPFRQELLARYMLSNNPAIDVKPIFNSQTMKLINKKFLYSRLPHEYIKRNSIKQPDSIRGLLQSKFLLAVEGNDVASGLMWMLYSNSVVFMSNPTVTSWALEGYLFPWQEYVPVHHDFHDLEEKLTWCMEEGTYVCEQIAKKGQIFVQQFQSEKDEENLVRRILELYGSKVQFWTDGNLELLSGAGMNKRNLQFASQCPKSSIPWPQASDCT